MMLSIQDRMLRAAKFDAHLDEEVTGVALEPRGSKSCLRLG